MSTASDQTAPAATAATTIDQSTDSHVTRLHRAVIGPVSAAYYLPVLERLDTRARAIPIWNWAACLCTLNWMAFRGLWVPALLYASALVGAALGVVGLIRLAPPMPESLQWSLWAALITMALLIPGFFGNAWMYAVYRKRLAWALAHTASVQEACQLLNSQASTRRRLVAVVLVNLLLAGLLLALWTWQPTRYRSPVVDGEITSSSAAKAAPEAAHGPATDAPAPDHAPAASAADPQAQAEATLAASAPASATGPTSPESPGQAAADTGMQPDPQEAAAGSALPAQRASAAASATAVDPQPDAKASAGTSASPTPATTVTTAAEKRRSTRFGIPGAKKLIPEPAAPAESPASAAPATVKPPPAPKAAPGGRFLINVGLFAQDDNARRTHARLRDAGLPATTQELQRPGGTLTRVRAGPFATRADADAAASKIRAMGLEAVVFRQ